MTPQVTQYVIPGVIIVGVLALRMRSMTRVRPLALRPLLIAPILLVGIAAVTIFVHPPGALGLALSAPALAGGGLLGWQRGRMTRIERDPATGKLTQQASPAAMLLLIGIIVVRFVARAAFVGDPAAAAASGGMSPQALLVTDVALAFAVGLIGMTRIEMYIRAKRLLASSDTIAA